MQNTNYSFILNEDGTIKCAYIDIVGDDLKKKVEKMSKDIDAGQVLTSFTNEHTITVTKPFKENYNDSMLTHRVVKVGNLFYPQRYSKGFLGLFKGWFNMSFEQVDFEGCRTYPTKSTDNMEDAIKFINDSVSGNTKKKLEIVYETKK